MSAQPATAATPLFRPEVMAAHGASWMGAIRLAQPVSGWLVAGAALAIAAALLAFAALGSVTKKARVAGITVARGGSLGIAAPTAGVLARALVSEGETVAAGQALFELSTERQGGGGELTALIGQQLEARRQALDTERRVRAAQQVEKRQALELRLQNSATEASQLEREITLARRRHALARQSLAKYETLQRDGYVSPAQAQQKQEEVIDLETRISFLERGKLQLAANSMALAADLSHIQRAQAALEQEVVENRSRKSHLLTAPQAGTVTTVTYQPGQAVMAGQALATLVPLASGKGVGREAGGAQAGGLDVHLFAPSRTAGFVAKGQAVLIRYSAFPYQKFGLQKGVVTDVSSTPFAPNELPQNLAGTILGNTRPGGAGGGEGLYRIKVTLARQTIDLYGKQQPLKPGMTLEADVVQDRRKVWEWIAEPALAMMQR